MKYFAPFIFLFASISVVLFVHQHQNVPVATGSTGSASGIDFPRSDITPGAINPLVTQANINKTICVPGWTKTIRPPSSYTSALEKKQLAGDYSYLGITDPSLTEEDHYLPLTDGGSPTDPKNLWPMPYPQAREKDKYEVYLNRQICRGYITLEEGQRRITIDWHKWYVEAGLDKNFGATLTDEDDE